MDRTKVSDYGQILRHRESPEALAQRASSLKITDKKGAKEKTLFGKKTIPEKNIMQYRVLPTIIEKSTMTLGAPSPPQGLDS